MENTSLGQTFTSEVTNSQSTSTQTNHSTVQSTEFIDNSPFVLIKCQEGYCICMGPARLTEFYSTKALAMKQLKTWNFYFSFTCELINGIGNQLYTQKMEVNNEPVPTGNTTNQTKETKEAKTLDNPSA